jgi:phospholipid transport system substrate-binding protein
MIRLLNLKSLLLLVISLNIFSEKNSEIFSFIDDNAQYFLQLIKNDGNEFESNPEEFKNKLKDIWEPMVDVRLVSRLILNDAYNGASEEQIGLFEERTKKLLLDTYVTTLLEFKEYDIETQTDIRVNKNKTYEVSFKFSSANAYSFSSKFTIYRNKKNELKIINIIIDGINLGLTFRNQFKDVYRDSALDLDRAIKNWQPLSSDEIFSDS